MSVPSSPYTTSAAVAYLSQVPLNMGTDFSASTTPTKVMVDQTITWISSQIEMQFAMAGYVIPFAVVSGETWPTFQTTYLQLVSTMGTAAMASGWAQKPAPALSPGQKGGTGNIWQDLYNLELVKIFNAATSKTQLRFRADYRDATPAQEILTTPRGPTTDFLEGKFDPMRQYPLWEMSDKVVAIEQSMMGLEISWDYLYSLFNIDKGFGTSVYE